MPNSSATICPRLVPVPPPTSVAPINSSTLPSASMRTRALEEEAEVVGDLCSSATPKP